MMSRGLISWDLWFEFGFEGKLKRPVNNAAVVVTHSVGAEENHISRPPQTKSAHREQFQKAEHGGIEIESVNAQPAEQEGQAEGRPPVCAAS